MVPTNGGLGTEEECLEHTWMGKIGDPKARQKEFTGRLKKFMNVGVLILMCGVACLLGAYLSGIIFLWVLSYPLVLIGLIFTLYPAFHLRKGTYSVVWNEYLKGPEKKIWIDDGKLEASIKNQLYSHKFEYEKAKAVGYHLLFKVDYGLRIVVTTVSFGADVTMQLRIEGISEANAEEAKRLRRALDKIDLPSTISTGG